MKATVLCLKDIDPGATDDELTLLVEARFTGTEAEIPGRVLNAMGANGNGVPVAINITQLAQYGNRMEDALLAERDRLFAAGLLTGTLSRTDCLFPSYTRGTL